MRNKQVTRNAILAVLQTIVLGTVLFLLYRHLLQVIGVEKLGIWSLVLASTSVTRIANLGLSGSVVKYVAKYAANEDFDAVARVVQTTVISVGTFVGLLLALLYPVAPSVIAWVLPPDSVADALMILPYAFVSVWLSVVYMVYMGAIDGLQRVDIRSTITIIGSVLQAVLAIWLVGDFGLVGLAVSQVFQYLLLTLMGFIYLRRLVVLPPFPYQWDQALFREMLNYGVNFQAISIVTMLYDPITKGLIARFGDMSTLGFYEMASRLVIQMRSLIVSANQALVPTIASLHERSSESLQSFYTISVKLVFFVTIPMFTALAVASSTISIAWIGGVEPSFVIAILTLCIGWGVNTLSTPAYFWGLGLGELRWNTVSHVVIGATNVGLGFILGSVWGGTGVLIGWMLALVTGSLVLLVSYSKGIKNVFNLYVTRENLQLVFGANASILLVVLILSHVEHYHWLAQFLIIGGVLIVCMAFPIWLHSARQQVQMKLLRQ